VFLKTTHAARAEAAAARREEKKRQEKERILLVSSWLTSDAILIIKTICSLWVRNVGNIGVSNVFFYSCIACVYFFTSMVDFNLIVPQLP
jgi:hypothetical protein